MLGVWGKGEWSPTAKAVVPYDIPDFAKASSGYPPNLSCDIRRSPASAGRRRIKNPTLIGWG